MKVRIGYVSNSSSSSFICDVCGRVESGYDASPTEFYMYKLECGHTICMSETNKKITLGQVADFVDGSNLTGLLNEIKEKIKENGRDFIIPDSELEEILEEIENEFGSYEMPKFLCPICNMKYISEKSKYEYLLKKFNLDDKEIIAEIQGKYNDLDIFIEDMKK